MVEYSAFSVENARTYMCLSLKSPRPQDKPMQYPARLVPKARVATHGQYTSQTVTVFVPYNSGERFEEAEMRLFQPDPCRARPRRGMTSTIQ